MVQLNYQQHERPSWRLDDPSIADPWKNATLNDGDPKNDWMMSYVDILTLLLTLVVMLLAYQKIQYRESQKTAETTVAEAPSTPRPLVLESPNEPPSLPGITLENPDTLFPEAAPLIDTAMEIPNIPSVEPQPLAENDFPEISIIDDGELNREASIQAINQTLPFSEAIDQEGLTEHVDISQVDREIRLEISNEIIFPSGSARMMPEGLALLEKLATIINQKPGTVFIEGHTDSTPISTRKYPSNWDLSSARATMVTRHLVAHGVSPTRLRAVGYADTKPRDDTSTADAKAQNRRVSIVISLPKQQIQAKEEVEKVAPNAEQSSVNESPRTSKLESSVDEVSIQPTSEITVR